MRPPVFILPLFALACDSGLLLTAPPQWDAAPPAITLPPAWTETEEVIVHPNVRLIDVASGWAVEAGAPGAGRAVLSREGVDPIALEPGMVVVAPESPRLYGKIEAIEPLDANRVALTLSTPRLEEVFERARAQGRVQLRFEDRVPTKGAVPIALTVPLGDRVLYDQAIATRLGWVELGADAQVTLESGVVTLGGELVWALDMAPGRTRLDIEMSGELASELALRAELGGHAGLAFDVPLARPSVVVPFAIGWLPVWIEVAARVHVPVSLRVESDRTVVRATGSAAAAAAGSPARGPGLPLGATESDDDPPLPAGPRAGAGSGDRDRGAHRLRVA